MEWQPIETAPEDNRVMVAGWQEKRGNVIGYWWQHEDVIWDGKPMDHPNALLWQPLPELPKDPPPAGVAQ